MEEDQETQSCPDHHDKDDPGENKPVDIAKGRLYIKLKFPTVANRSNEEEVGMHGDEKLETPQTRKEYICDFCNKRFSSGKGLGGHKRVHTQATKKHNQFLHKKIHKPKFKKSGGVDDRYHSKAKKEDFDATCAMCGKSFPSMKSLFGHMRSHPEREWRGIHPPVRSNRSLSVATVDPASVHGVQDRATVDPDDTSQTSSPADDELLQSISEWRVTGKGRNKSGEADVSGLPLGPVRSDWVSTELELEASDNLLLLAKGNDAMSNSSSRGDICNAEEVIKDELDDKTRACTELMAVPKKQNMESSPPDKKMKRESSQADRAYTTTDKGGKGKAKMEEFQGCDDDDGDDNNDEVVIKGYSHDQRGNEVESNCEDGEYKVTQYQLELDILVENGLQKGNIQKKKRKRSPRKSEAGADDIARCISHGRNISKTPDRFRCNICKKSFSTHQALGGHMSSHSKVTIKKSQTGDYRDLSASADQEADERAAIVAANQEAEKDGGAHAECRGDSGDGAPSGQASSRKMLVLDLNKFPPMDEDEDEQEG